MSHNRLPRSTSCILYFSILVRRKHEKCSDHQIDTVHIDIESVLKNFISRTSAKKIYFFVELRVFWLCYQFAHNPAFLVP